LTDLKTNQNNWILPGKYVNAAEIFQPDDPLGFTNRCNGTYYLTTCDPVQAVYSRYAYDVDSTFCTFYKQSSWPLTQPETGAWWVSGGKKAVSCYPTLTFNNGQKVSFSEHGNFMIYRPGVSTYSEPAPVITWVDLTEAGPDKTHSLHCNYSYEATVECLPPVTGTATYTQLINRDENNNWDSLNLFCLLFTGDNTHGWVLDQDSPYGKDDPAIFTSGGNPTQRLKHSDSPDIEDLAGCGHFNDYVYCKDQFKVYLQFQPPGGIAVTLATIGWGWEARETKDGAGVWHAGIRNPDGPHVNLNDDAFPEWKNAHRK